MKAYDIAKGISRMKSNYDRQNYAFEIAEKIRGNVVGLQFVEEGKYGTSNIIIKNNTSLPTEYAIGAHFDAVLKDNGLIEAHPGANDNGSGVGIVLELAEKLKGLPIDFFLFCGEELLTCGSDFYLPSEFNAKGFINYDTCGSGNLILSPSKETGIPHVDIRSKMIYGAFFDETSKFGIIPLDYRVQGDNLNFEEASIPNLAISTYSYKYILPDRRGITAWHSEYDTEKFLDEKLMKKIVDISVNALEKLINH
jgi:Zn-dependent M28 family amino/carboxypeptidase